MIKNLIKKLFKKEVSKPEKKVEETAPVVHTTVPAPVVTPNDFWFGEAPKTEKVIEYVKQKNEELYQRLAEQPQSKEVDNIHQVMYDKATKGVATTLTLDSLGGSEEWQSGTGYNQFKSGTGYNQFRD